MIPGGTGAALDLGGFGYKNDDPGPGVLVASLPPNTPARSRWETASWRWMAAHRRRRPFAETMAKIDQEKAAVATVQRGKERMRMETRIILPKRDAGGTARVQAKYIPEDKEIQIVSRTVTELRVTVPRPGFRAASIGTAWRSRS